MHRAALMGVSSITSRRCRSACRTVHAAVRTDVARSSHIAHFLVFVSGGVLSAAVDIGLMQLLISRGVGSITATTAGFMAGLVLNFVFHANVTYKQAASAAAVIRYLCVVGLNYLITMALVALAVHLFGQALWGKLASLPVVAVNGYLLGKFWIYK